MKINQRISIYFKKYSIYFYDELSSKHSETPSDVRGKLISRGQYEILIVNIGEAI